EQKLYLKSKLDEMQHTITHYEVQLKLSEFTSALHDGSACPLCGAVEHPNVLQIKDVNTHIDEAKVKVQELKQKDLEIDQIHSALESLEFKYRQLKEEITGVELQMRSANERVTNHYNKFEWSGFEKDNELLLEEKFNQAKDIKQQLEEAEHDLEILNLKYQDSEDRYQRFKVAIDKIQRDLDVKNAEVSLLRNQFNGQDYAILVAKPSGELLQEKERLQAHIVKVQSEFNRITDLLQVNKQQYEVLKTRIETAQSHLNEVKRDFELVSAQIQEELQRSDFEHIESVKKILEQQASVTSLESELKDYDFKLYSLQQKYIELKQELQGKTFDEAAYEALKGEYELLKRECQEKNDEFIREQHLIKQQELNLERKAALEKQIDQLQIRKDNISVLKNMFKGSGFVSYISAVYLNQLCASANERFYKLTHQQLRLEVTEKNDFQVRDFLNDGKLRSVKTLSGGQTFQASLSLALALAESVQQQNKSKQNFFFLDEGFGSLDKESLQVAFSTLKSLRKENRIVGVISHVEDLQQEIDVFLKVKNDAVEGSTIKGSWE
ncbi:SMC family ATPase, partial [Pseudoxanthomonas sp. SGD-10]